MNAKREFIHVWFVQGDPDTFLFDTKESAGVWARVLFPNEDPDKRYARLFFRPLIFGAEVPHKMARARLEAQDQDSIVHLPVKELSPGRVLDYAVEVVLHTPKIGASTTWAVGGPLIERYQIDVGVSFIGAAGVSNEVYTGPPTGWQARRYTVGGPLAPRTYYGETPLVAAMRCLVGSKLRSDTISVRKGDLP